MVLGTDFGVVLLLDTNLCLFHQLFHCVETDGGFFRHLSQVEPSGFLESFVWCILRHLRHRQCCLTISHLWLTVRFWNLGQAARWCFVLQSSGHVSSSVSLPLVALFSVFLGPFSRRLSFLPSEKVLVLPWEQILASNVTTRWDCWRFLHSLLFSFLCQNLNCLLDHVLTKVGT